MKFPPVTVADCRVQVEKALAVVPSEKALVHTTAEGLKIQPLYTELTVPPAPAPASPAPFELCMPYDGGDPRAAEALAEDRAGGAEAIWLRGGADVARLFVQPEAHRKRLVLDVAHAPAETLD